MPQKWFKKLVNFLQSRIIFQIISAYSLIYITYIKFLPVKTLLKLLIIIIIKELGNYHYKGKIIFYLFLKITLGSIGFISTTILIFLFFLIIKTMFFSSIFISFNDLVDFGNLCENEDYKSSISKKCENIILIYWLVISAFIFCLLSILTLYPFFKIKKTK